MPRCVKPLGHHLLMGQSLELPDGRAELSSGASLELVPGRDGYASAVVRRSADGSVTWQALPSEGEQDAWVAVQLSGDILRCSSWSCWLVGIDASTGAVIDRHFTK